MNISWKSFHSTKFIRNSNYVCTKISEIFSCLSCFRWEHRLWVKFEKMLIKIISFLLLENLFHLMIELIKFVKYSFIHSVWLGAIQSVTPFDSWSSRHVQIVLLVSWSQHSPTRKRRLRYHSWNWEKEIWTIVSWNENLPTIQELKRYIIILITKIFPSNYNQSIIVGMDINSFHFISSLFVPLCSG